MPVTSCRAPPRGDRSSRRRPGIPRPRPRDRAGHRGVACGCPRLPCCSSRPAGSCPTVGRRRSAGRAATPRSGRRRRAHRPRSTGPTTRRAGTRPTRRLRRVVGEEHPPQVGAVLAALHVDVDLDVPAGHDQFVDAPQPVGRLRAEAGPGPVDLKGKVVHRRVAVAEGLRRQPARSSATTDTLAARSAICRRRRGMISAMGVCPSTPGTRSARSSRSTLPVSSRAVRSSRAARPCRSVTPRSRCCRRFRRFMPGSRLRSDAASRIGKHHTRQPHSGQSGMATGSACNATVGSCTWRERGVDDRQPVGEGAVVGLHGGQEPVHPLFEVLGPVPALGVEVVPGQPLRRADDPAPSTFLGTVAARLEHPLVVRQLDEVPVERPGRRAR